MEHPVDVSDIPPLFEPKLVELLRRRVGEEEARGGARAPAWKAELNQIVAAMNGWQDLARLARRMMLGDRAVYHQLEAELSLRLEECEDSEHHRHGERSPAPTRHGHARASGDGHGHANPEPPGDTHAHAAGHGCVVNLAVVLDILCGLSALYGRGELDSALSRTRRALEALARRLLSLARNASERARLLGGTKFELDDGCHCDLSETFLAWEELDPISFFDQATREDANNGALDELTPTSATPGAIVVLSARASAKFTAQRPAGVEVVFFPGVSAKVVDWGPREVRVEVPPAARSGPIAFGKQLSEAAINRISELRHALSHRFPCDFGRSLIGLRAPQTLVWPRALRGGTRAEVEVLRPPRIATFRAYDGKGRALKAGEAGQGDEITIAWRVISEGPLTAPITLLVDGKKVHEVPVPGLGAHGHPCTDGSIVLTDGEMPAGFEGTLRVTIDVADLFVAELIAGQHRARITLPPILRFNVSPNPMQLRRGRRSSLLVVAREPMRREARVRVRSESGQVGFLPRSDGSSDVFTLHEGQSIAVFPLEHVGGSDVARGVAPETPDDVIHVTWDQGDFRDMPAADVPVWVQRPQGRWEAPHEGALELVGVHATVLHSGKVLYFSFAGDSLAPGFADLDRGSSQVWDPTTRTAGPLVEVGRNLFCAGQLVLPDGRVFAAGGQNAGGAAPERGEAWRWFGDIFSGAMADTHTFDPATETWARHDDMREGRYYPTCVLLPDGRPLIAGGLSDLIEYVIGSGNGQNDQFEISDGGAIVDRGKFRASDQYPVIMTLPRSRLLFVHVKNATYYFDLDERKFLQMPAEFFGDFGATQDFKIAAVPGVGKQTYPAQTGFVMLPLRSGTGSDAQIRIFCIGGSASESPGGESPALARGFIFEFDPARPRSSFWRETRRAPLNGRILSDTVLLPDGSVLIINGARRGHANDPSEPVFEPEIFNPRSETFATMASSDPMHPRMYHSTAVLLPDGRVAVAGHTRLGNVGGLPGSTDDHSIEVFNPPYLFAGPRPVLDAAPSSAHFGDEITLETFEADVAKVTLLRPCAVTHSVDMNQRCIELDITHRDFDRMVVRLPSDSTLAPPGHYMLFLISDPCPPRHYMLFQLCMSGLPLLLTASKERARDQRPRRALTSALPALASVSCR